MFILFISVNGRAYAICASEFFRLYTLADGHCPVNVLGKGVETFTLPPELAAVIVSTSHPGVFG